MTPAHPPTLGVLITYYNEQHLLTECLESLLTGTDLPDEVWVYDDASPHPASDYIPQPWTDTVKVIRREQNHGPSYARNQLIHECQCEYLHLYDADDLFEPDWCTEVRAAINHGHDLVITHGNVLSLDGSINPITFIERNLTLIRSDYRAFAIQHTLNTQCITFKRSLAISIGGYQTHDLKNSLDYYFNARLALHSKTGCFVEKCLFRVRVRANSLSRERDGEERPLAFIENIRAMMLLSDEAAAYAPMMSNKIVHHASRLYKSGEKQVARQGFSYALKLGTPTYNYLGQPWRTIAKVFGPLAAERAFELYTWPGLVRLRGHLKRFVGR